jgi:hypothetical protein
VWFGGNQGMKPSYQGHRFPAEIIRHAVWLYRRFTLSFRDVEDLLAERGITGSYASIRRCSPGIDPFSPARDRTINPLAGWEFAFVECASVRAEMEGNLFFSPYQVVGHLANCLRVQ